MSFDSNLCGPQWIDTETASESEERPYTME